MWIDFQLIESTKNTINIEELVDENFEGPCIIKLYQAYIGSSKSISLLVKEILARKIEIREFYFKDEESSTEEYKPNPRLSFYGTQRLRNLSSLGRIYFSIGRSYLKTSF